MKKSLLRSCLTLCAAALVLPSSAHGALTGQYRFDEGSGTTALDSSGFSRHGTLTGTTGAPAYVGGLHAGSASSLRFNYDSGTSSYDNSQLQRVALPMNTSFVRNAPAMTMAAWIRPDVIASSPGLLGSTRTVLAVSDGSGPTSARGVMQMLAVSGQLRILGRRIDGGPNAFYTTAGASPFSATAGQTYFVVGILDYVNAQISVYINGVQHTGGTFTGLANLGAAGPVNVSADTTNLIAHIGTNAGGTGEQWNGGIDDIRIFDHALTSEEILSIYNAELVPEPTAATLAIVLGLAFEAIRRLR